MIQRLLKIPFPFHQALDWEEKMIKYLHLLFFITILAICSFNCTDTLLGEDQDESYSSIFNLIWTEFDEQYASFDQKSINWDSLYTVYYPLATSAKNDDQLFGVITEMLDQLDDSHVSIDNTKKLHTSGFEDELESTSQFNLAITSDYLSEPGKYKDFTAYYNGFYYGKIDSIGYIFITGFDDSEGSNWADGIDQIISELSGTKGLIIDLRVNPGGTDVVAHRIASAFASEKRVAYKVKTRNGPKHTDFDSPKTWYLDPSSTQTYTKPIAVLTNRYVVSAAEVFLLLIKSQDHVTQIGDTTSGAFSDVSFTKFLPNGWSFELSHQLYMNPDGTSPEGIGCIPDIYVVNEDLYTDTGNSIKDNVLEEALQHLR